MAEISARFMCPLCDGMLDDPQITSCKHSFCKKCLQEVTESIPCPTCSAIIRVGNWMENGGLNAFLQFFNSLDVKQKNSVLSWCHKCACETDSNEVQFCEQCSRIFCLGCSIIHEKDTRSEAHSLYSLSNDRSLYCEKHNVKRTKVCITCYLMTCYSCADLDHQDHEIYELKECEKLSRDDFLILINYSETDLNMQNDYICKLEAKKPNFQKSVDHIRSMLKERYDFMLKTVKDTFNKEINDFEKSSNNMLKDYDNQIIDRLNARSFLAYAKETYIGDYSKLSNYRIIKDYMRLREGKDKVFAPSSLEYITMSMTPIYFNKEDFATHVESVFGSSNIELDKDSFHKYFRGEFKLLFKKLTEYRCGGNSQFEYDRKHQCIYMTIGKASILKFFESDQLVEKYELVPHKQFNFDKLVYIALLTTKEFICFTNKSKDNLFLVNTSMQCRPYPVFFTESSNLKLVCASPCREFVFFYFKNGSMYKHNLLNDSLTRSIYKCCVHKPEFMTVSPNLEEIVMLETEEMSLCSFTYGHVIKRYRGCFTAVFLSENIVAGHDHYENAIYVYYMKERTYRTFKQFIPEENFTENSDYSWPVFRCSANSMLLCVYNSNNYVVYKIRF